MKVSLRFTCLLIYDNNPPPPFQTGGKLLDSRVLGAGYPLIIKLRQFFILLKNNSLSPIFEPFIPRLPTSSSNMSALLTHFLHPALPNNPHQGCQSSTNQTGQRRQIFHYPNNCPRRPPAAWSAAVQNRT